MRKFPLSIHGGGSLEITGSPGNSRWVLMLCRDNFRLDDPLAGRVVRHFHALGYTVARYEARVAETRRMIHPPWQDAFPVYPRFALKAMRLLAHPARWPYFLPRYRQVRESIPYRVRSLRELIAHLEAATELHLVTRSASGRVASLVADEFFQVCSTICMGYPFQHPAHGPEPERYAHLANLRTPMLILQGTRDVYGGREIEGRYSVSKAVEIQWIDTDHDFTVPESGWANLFERMASFMGEAAARGGGPFPPPTKRIGRLAHRS